MELTFDQLLALQRLSTCAVADAIEAFEIRLRNVGFTDGSVRCWCEDLPSVVGYAVTARVRTAVPPMIGTAYADRSDWWSSLEALPAPRIAVIQDMDEGPGAGALVGRFHGDVLRALGVVAVVTNGAVRDVPHLRAIGLQCFAGRVVPSHAYAHVFEFGIPVRVGGLEVRPGDLLHGDRHGVVTIPPGIAPRLPATARRIDDHLARVRALCASPEFSLERLRALLVDPDGAPVAPGGHHEVSTDE